MTAANQAWIWLNPAVVSAIHDEQLAEHGGLRGTRETGLLTSALNRPRNAVLYGDPDAATLAAAYGFGIARNHPFADGNKRTAFVATELFLELNGYSLDADDADCVLTMLALASNSLDEAMFADWIRQHLQAHAA